MSRWAIIDIDGTISDCSERIHFAHAARNATDVDMRSKWWDRFHSYCSNDKPHEAEILLIKCWLAGGNRIAYLTGRSDKYRVQTQRWLQSHALPQTPLFMQDNGNYTSSVEYKIARLKTIREQIMGPRDVISFVLEDNDRLVEMWRGLGFTCLQPRHSSY